MTCPQLHSWWMAEPIPEPGFLNLLWRAVSTEFLWVTAHCKILMGRWQKSHHGWDQCFLSDGDIRRLAFKEACHPCKNHYGWVSQPERSLTGGPRHCWPPEVGHPQLSDAANSWLWQIHGTLRNSVGISLLSCLLLRTKVMWIYSVYSILSSVTGWKFLGFSVKTGWIVLLWDVEGKAINWAHHKYSLTI